MQMNIDIWNLLYNHLEERHHNNIYQNVMQDADYLKFTQQEQELCSQYENLNLSDDQRKVILNWVPSRVMRKFVCSLWLNEVSRQ